MSSWRECKLGDVLNFGNGKSRPKIEGDYPIYGGNGILGYANEFNYTDETIILGRVGAYCGSVYYENKPIWVSDNALSVKPKEGNHSKFLYYFLKNMDLNSHAGGSSHPLITQSLLNSLDVEICTNYEEQKVIAEVLSSLDDKIDLLHRQNQTLESLAKTLFRQWFIEEVKEEWEDISLAQCCIKITKGTTPTTLKKQFVESGINFIKVNCIDEKGSFLKDKFDFIDDETNELLNRSKLEKSDILYSIAGTIGRLAIVQDEILPANVNQALAILRVNKSIINPYFVKYCLLDKDITFELHSKIVHAVQPNLSLGEISNTLIPYPPKEILDSFSNQIESIEEKISQNKKQIQTLENLRDTLLPKLLSGEVRVEI